MFENPIVKDQFGRRFRLSLPKHRINDDQRLSVRFSSQDDARTFLKSFREDDIIWRQLDASENGFSSNVRGYDPLNGISNLLYKGFIRAVQLPRLDSLKNSPTRRTLSKNSGELYQFVDSKTADPAKKAKKFGDFDAARTYVENMGASDKELDRIAEGLNVETKPGFESSGDKIASAMADGDVVVQEGRRAQARNHESFFEEIIEDVKEAGLGPESDVSVESDVGVDNDIRDLSAQAETLEMAAAVAAVFCEECEKKKTA